MKQKARPLLEVGFFYNVGDNSGIPLRNEHVNCVFCFLTTGYLIDLTDTARRAKEGGGKKKLPKVCALYGIKSAGINQERCFVLTET